MQEQLRRGDEEGRRGAGIRARRRSCATCWRTCGDTTKKVSRFERVPYSLPLALDPEKDLAELAQVLGLPAPPQRIEGFDISNISGTFKVASLVSFRNGRPDRANYRRFKIKTVEGQDDFASVAEVVRRRYTRLLKGVQSPRKTYRRAGGERRADEPAAPGGLRTPHSAFRTAGPDSD